MADDTADPDRDAIDGRRRTRWTGLVGLTATRLWKRATRTVTGRIVSTIVAVALTIAFLLVITGVALALAEGGVASETDADVRITPEEGGTLSTVDGLEGPRLGMANDRTTEIRSQSGVDHASPVLLETVRLESTDGEPRTILLVGVAPDDEPRTVAGLSTSELASADSGSDGGTDGRPPNSAIVLSDAASDRLDASAGDEVAVSSVYAGSSSPSLTVGSVEESSADAETDVPVALVRLSDLQTFAGADEGQLATQLLVWGESDAAASAAEEAYPHATIESTNGGDPSTLLGDGLALATSLLALVVGVSICAAFVATTMGMTVDRDRRTLAVLEAVGFPTRSRLAVVALTTGLTTLCGAVLGLGLGVLGIAAVNAIASATLATGTVAIVTPLFVPYALAVALLSGLVAVPYPLAVAGRTTVLEEVSR
ncbi:FtsX-like permease family protein [Halosolutus amylolyticus]|uniref:FtsX-like permease family protein n=1 Tax=Halosolutus amylolyticus TaxID=2932267 RepID=A0ABD5PSH3_9EURY|nr:FtsX-like permease family protein [Halosolutus amylolyticus]